MLRLFLIFITCSFILVGCQGLSDAGKIIRNEKINSNDEFLVKKKEPLTMPPDFDKLPLPNSVTNKSDLSEEEKIKKIIKLPKENLNKNKKSSTIEDSIIEQIR